MPVLHIPNKELHFFTQTLNPKYYKLPVSQQYDETKHAVRRILKEYSSYFVITVELTEKTNIHYHAIVALSNPEFKHHVIEKLRFLGGAQFNTQPITLENRQRTIDYIMKDQELMKKFIYKPYYEFIAKEKPERLEVQRNNRKITFEELQYQVDNMNIDSFGDKIEPNYYVVVFD